MTALLAEVPQPVRIDIGCGKNKREGFIGVDQHGFPGVDYVLNFGASPWPWDDNSVDEAHCSHVIEHLTNFGDKWERVHFFNELHRVLKPSAKCALIFPHWASSRFYGDPTHKEPLSEWWSFYLLKSWRAVNAPHCDFDQAPGPQSYKCDFDVTYGYNMHPSLNTRNQEYQMHALTFWKEAAQDVHATLVARK
jgi:SAM-dependent methyltransferase